MRGARVALAAGLALTAIALALTLSGSPATVAQTNAVSSDPELATIRHPAQICQGGETLPRGTTALRLSLKALIGPRVTVTALSGTRVVTSGARAPGWTGGAVTVPVARVLHPVSPVKICVVLAPKDESVEIAGTKTPRATAAIGSGGRALRGRMRIESLRPGSRSWWSLALSTARRMGLGRAWPGTWVAALVLALMVAVLVLACRLVLRLARPSRRRIPAAAWACALVACLNAVAWSILTPPFQVPDETDHFAFVQQLAQTGRPPASSKETYSAAETVALLDLNQFEVRLQPEFHTISSDAEEQKLEIALARQASIPQRPTDDAGVAAGEPPLYYALQAIPFSLAGGTVLERLALMRLLSALMAGITALFVFLFLREALLGVAWAWTVGALAVALAPLLGFMSGAVNPDAMLFAVSAALFYCLARAFRRGLTPRVAVAIGGAAGLGLATKLNFVGLAPGVLVGLTVLTVRARRGFPRRAHRALALALLAAAGPVLATIAVNLLSHRPPLGSAFGAAAASVGHHGTALGQLVYVWQLYLPRLPGMARDFPGVFAPRQIWLDGYVGLFGWLDTTFPTWVYNLALVPTVLLAGLCVRTLLAIHVTVRRRMGELAVYAAVAGGLLLLLGVKSYGEFPEYSASYGEARYLLPLLPLLGAALALAARGAGRRWGPALGTVIVVLAFAHDLFSQLQLVARYYS